MAEATALERAHLTIRGVRAELVLEDGHITLSKEGATPTSITFAVDQVRGTVLEPGSRGGRGWIHLAVVGGTSAPPGELAAMSDPYTLPLTSRATVTARRLARIVEKHLRERGLPSEPVFAASALASGRFSSGVALTRAPGAARETIELRADDGPPPAPRAGTTAVRAVSPAAEPSTTSSSRVETAGSEEDDPRLVAAEAVIDDRAAAEAATAAALPSAPPSEPTVAASGGWVKPSGPTAGSAPGSAGSPVPSEPPPLAPPPLGPPPTASSRGRELAAELRELGELHAAGVLTDAEFEQAKARVLS
jgi:hypothetical protein